MILFWQPPVRLLTELWSFERDTVLAPWGRNLALRGHMGMAGLVGHLSLVGVGAVWRLGLGFSLMRTVVQASYVVMVIWPS